MGSRTRSRQAGTAGSYTAYPSGATVVRSNQLVYNETTSDVTGNPKGDNPLTIQRVEKHVEGFSGDSKTSPTSTIFNVYENYWPTYANSSLVTHLSVDTPSKNEAAINVIARSNPSKPHVDVALFLYELREVPRLLKGVANYLRLNNNPFSWVQQLGSNQLEYTFGLAPLVSDLQKLFFFHNEVARNVAKLKKLSNGGIRSQVRVGTGVNNSLGNPIIESSTTIRALVDTITTEEVWASTRWTPKPGTVLPTTDEERVALANSIVYSSKITPQTVWNGIPWSWLIDWCSNMGEYLSTYNNTLNLSYSPPCVMRMTKTTITGQPQIPPNRPNLKGGYFNMVRTTKTRTIVPFLLPEARVPFLNSGQALILGSLAASRIPGYARRRLQADTVDTGNL